jgi:hypothetical protein
LDTVAHVAAAIEEVIFPNPGLFTRQAGKLNFC